MSDKFVMSSRQASELDHAMERNGCDPAFVKWLSTGSVLGQLREVYEGISQIVGTPLTTLDVFIQQTLVLWHGKRDAKKARVHAQSTELSTLDFKELASDVDREKFGEYSLNKDMEAFGFSVLTDQKIKIIALPEFAGRAIYEVATHVVATYGKTHKIPGVEFWSFVCQSSQSDERVASLKNNCWNFFFGSLVRYSDGRARVPCADSRGSEWRRGADWLGNGWGSACRVVLLEK